MKKIKVKTKNLHLKPTRFILAFHVLGCETFLLFQSNLFTTHKPVLFTEWDVPCMVLSQTMWRTFSWRKSYLIYVKSCEKWPKVRKNAAVGKLLSATTTMSDRRSFHKPSGSKLSELKPVSVDHKEAVDLGLVVNVSNCRFEFRWFQRRARLLKSKSGLATI